MTDWNAVNEQILRDNAGKLSANEIAKLIPGATRSGVVGKMSRMELAMRPPGRYRNGVHLPKGSMAIGRRKSTQNGGVSNPVGNKVRLFQTSLDERIGGTGPYKLAPVDDIPLDIPNFLCKAVSLDELTDGMCRWPLDAGQFCGGPRWADNPYGKTQYCAPHHRLGHKPASEHRRLNPR